MFTKESILLYLKDINNRLKSKKLNGEVMVAGDVVTLLEFQARDAFKDIEALYEFANAFSMMAFDMAKEYNLPIDWLKTAVKAFIGPEPPRDKYFGLSNLSLYLVQPEYMLMVKLRAAREKSPELDDIKSLINQLQLDTVDKALNLVGQFHDLRYLPPKILYILEEIIDLAY